MLQTLNDAPTPLVPSLMVGQGDDFFGAHPLSEVEPENHTVALLVGPGQATVTRIRSSTRDRQSLEHGN